MKALATSQIILLVLGIIVLAVIGYMVYTQYVAGSTQFGQTNCQSEAVSTCTNCKTCVSGLGGSFASKTANENDASCGRLCSLSDKCGEKLGSPKVDKNWVVDSGFCTKYAVA